MFARSCKVQYQSILTAFDKVSKGSKVAKAKVKILTRMSDHLQSIFFIFYFLDSAVFASGHRVATYQNLFEI